MDELRQSRGLGGSLREIVRLANEWGVTVDELMCEVEEI